MRKLLTQIVFSSVLLVGIGASSRAVTPTAINNLTALTGTEPGQVILQWTSPPETINRYLIRYQNYFSASDLIDTDAKFLSAQSVAAPPLNLTPPTPGSPSTAVSYTVNGLEPGTTYSFSIKSDGGSIGTPELSSISNATAALSGAACGANSFDGLGSASIDPPSISKGDFVVVTVTYTVDSNGIQNGGMVAVRVPDFWPEPDKELSNFNVGYATAATSKSTVGIDIKTSSQTIIAELTSGSLSSGDKIYFQYNTVTCVSDTVGRFNVFSQYSSCGELVKLNSDQTVSLTEGSVKEINFEYGTQYVPANTPSLLTIQARNYCGNAVNVGSSIDIGLTPLVWNGNNFVTDSDVTMSVNSSMTPVLTPAVSSVTIQSGNSETNFYYQISSLGNSPNNYVKFSWVSFNNPPNVDYNFANVVPINGGITNVSVDSGILASGQTNVTFSPNSDGVDDNLFINFTVPSDNIRWVVEISSSGSNDVVAVFEGYGQNNRISWDGYNFFGNGLAEPGSYQIEIELEGGVIKNTSLTATLQAIGVKGRILNQSLTPLATAFINIFGPSGGNVVTGQDGRFSFYGLRAGQYNYRIEKYGYASQEGTFTISNATVDLGDIRIDQGAILHIGATRPSAPYLPEVFGEIRAHDANWTRFAFGTIHFSQGKTTSDAGDEFNVVLTTYTELFVKDGINYTVEFEMEGYSAADQTVNLTLGEVKDVVFTLTPAANIFGLITLPSGTDNTNGRWISVEAGIDADSNNEFDSFDTSSRYWGGVWLSPGELSGTYRIFGVQNGNYLVKVFADGFVQVSDHVNISGGADGTLNFNSFSTGGTLTLNLTINGDTSSYSEDGCSSGYFRSDANAWSPTTFIGSYKQLCIAKNATSTSHVAQLTGLSDGNYDVFVRMPGFESNPKSPIFATVSGAVGSKSITFSEYTGSITGTISLPTGQSDYSSLEIDVKTFGYDEGDGPSVTNNLDGTYSISKLGTNFYRVRAFYPPTGNFKEKGVQVVNGSASTLNFDLTDNTYSISGTVNTNARSPFNSLSYLVNTTTPTTVWNLNNSSYSIPANRIMAEKIDGFGFEDDHDPNSAQSGPRITIDSKRVFYATYSTTGDYIFRNLTEGSYKLYPNGELDNRLDNGPEIAQATRIIHLYGANQSGVNFTLSDGYNISGTLRVGTGVNEPGRNIEVRLKNAEGDDIVQQTVFVQGTQASFTLERINSGVYALYVQDFEYPKKYSAKDIRVEVNGTNVTGKDITLLSSAKIKGQLQIKTSGDLLNSNNYQNFLPSSFEIYAEANPWFPGGHGRANYPLIGSDGKFQIDLNPGNYDVVMLTRGSVSESDIAKGRKPFIPVRVSGISVEAGQTKDLGVVELSEGIRVTGTVKDSNGTALSNILVEAMVSGDHEHEGIQAWTDGEGKYTLYGIDPDGARYYDFEAAPRPDPFDEYFTASFENTQYAEVLRANVDTQKIKNGDISSIDFQLELAQGSISGTVKTPDNGTLYMPFDEGGLEKRGAEIILNKDGEIPVDNPLGNINDIVNPDGTFTVKGLAAGVYDMWILAKGYGGAYVSGIVVGSSNYDVGVVTVTAGATLSGSITKADGSYLNQREANAVIGVREGFQEVLVGNFTADAGGSLTSYSMSGFRPNKSYAILIISNEDEIIPLTSSITVNSNSTQNFVIRVSTPEIFASARRNSDSSYTLIFELSKALRNSSIDLDGNGTADDSEPSKILLLTTGSGSLTTGSSWISSDRKRISATYTPASGESSIVVRASATFVSVDGQTGLNHQRTKDFTFPLGVGTTKVKRLTNAVGGKVTMDNSSEFGAQAGTFGDNADLEIEVKMSSASAATTFSGQADLAGVNRMVAMFGERGPAAYPTDMVEAMLHAQAVQIDPLAPFYEIFLPAGVSHFFPQGKEAQLCLTYNDSVTDPSVLNIYYYNTTSNQYFLENQDRRIDTQNRRICVSLSHASVFTIFSSSQTSITGSGYSGPLSIMNFPNPFDLTTKTVTLQDPGTASSNQTIRGTMIKMSIPSGMSGAVEIDIFDILGQKVRTLRTNVATGGTHVYLNWDGLNENGSEVASGAYFGRFTIGGGNEKFFKMAVLK